MTIERFAVLALSLAACTDEARPDFDVHEVGVTAVGEVPTALPDLRFKWVGAFPSYLGIETSNTGTLIEQTFHQAAWGPLWLGYSATSPTTPDPDGTPLADWDVEAFLPTNFVAGYSSATSGVLIVDDFNTDVEPIAAAGIVTSMDCARDGELGYTSVVPDTGMPFVEVLGPATDLAATVADLASKRFVTTALTFDGTTIHVAAYLAHGDPTTYEVSVLAADLSTLPAQAAALGAGGYVITAMGTTDFAGGYALVGTRRTGETTPRAVTTVTQYDADEQLHEGGALVGAFVDPVTHKDYAILER